MIGLLHEHAGRDSTTSSLHIPKQSNTTGFLARLHPAPWSWTTQVFRRLLHEIMAVEKAAWLIQPRCCHAFSLPLKATKLRGLHMSHALRPATVHGFERRHPISTASVASSL